MPNIKKVISDNLCEEIKERLDREPEILENNTGYYNTSIPEPQPIYNQSDTEKVFLGENNSFIIMGRDRPRGISSGYGGIGATHAGSIDIIAGMTGVLVRNCDPKSGERVVTDKSPELDAARIYISQRCDIDSDEYFSLAPGEVGTPTARSAIAIKADGVRVIGREGIKLVTGTDTYNSFGVNLDDTTPGIDLIAGNDDRELEPLVKGTSLQVALLEMSELVAEINAIMTNFLVSFLTAKGAQALGSIDPATKLTSGTQAVFVLPNLVAQCQAHQFELFKWTNNYLYPWGEGYINSRFNNTN